MICEGLYESTDKLADHTQINCVRQHYPDNNSVHEYVT